MTREKPTTVRKVEHGSKYYIAVYQLVDYNIDTPRYKNTVHWHDHFELEILDSGKVIHMINGKAHPLKQYDAYLVTPADVHTLLPYGPENARVNITHIGFNESVISEDIFNELLALKGPLHATLTEEDYQSFRYILRLIKQNGSETQLSQRQQRSLCSYLILKFMELYGSQTHVREMETPLYPQREAKNDLYINKAISYIKYNFRNPKLTTQKVAQAVYLTPNYFGELFYKYMKITCLDYIRKLKLNFAMSLLCQSGITVAEISEKSGYASISYFIKDFKNEFGLTPQCYRLQLKVSGLQQGENQVNTEE